MFDKRSSHGQVKLVVPLSGFHLQEMRSFCGSLTATVSNRQSSPDTKL